MNITLLCSHVLHLRLAALAQPYGVLCSNIKIAGNISPECRFCASDVSAGSNIQCFRTDIGLCSGQCKNRTFRLQIHFLFRSNASDPEIALRLHIHCPLIHRSG